MFTTNPTTMTRSLRLGLAAAAAAALTGLAGCANDDPSAMPGMDHGSSSSASAAPSSPSAPSTSGSAPTGAGVPASGPHNDADVMFAQMMIPHHQQAVDMSDMLLAKTGVDPEITALAKQIKAAQGPEITTMTGWLEGWGEPVAADGGMGGMDHGGGDDGMLTPEQMQALDTADAETAQKLYLNGMLKHHQGAVRMAQDQIANGENPEAKELAQDIVTTQQAEIETMTTLLAGL